MYTCAYLCIPVFADVGIPVYTCLYLCVPLFVGACITVYTCVHMYNCVCLCKAVFNGEFYVFSCLLVYTFVFPCIHLYS